MRESPPASATPLSPRRACGHETPERLHPEPRSSSRQSALWRRRLAARARGVCVLSGRLVGSAAAFSAYSPFCAQLVAEHATRLGMVSSIRPRRRPARLRLITSMIALRPSQSCPSSTPYHCASGASTSRKTSGPPSIKASHARRTSSISGLSSIAGDCRSSTRGQQTGRKDDRDATAAAALRSPKATEQQRTQANDVPRDQLRRPGRQREGRASSAWRRWRDRRCRSRRQSNSHRSHLMGERTPDLACNSRTSASARQTSSNSVNMIRLIGLAKAGRSPINDHGTQSHIRRSL